MAAGALIVSEAGGRISNYVDGPMDLHAREVLASNGAIHDEMLAVLEAATAGA